MKKPRKPKGKPACAAHPVAAVPPAALVVTPKAVQAMTRPRDPGKTPAKALTKTPAIKAAVAATTKLGPPAQSPLMSTSVPPRRLLPPRPMPDPQTTVAFSRHCRDLAVLMMPFMITAIAIGVMQLDRQAGDRNLLVARHSLETQAGEKRALTGLPRQMTPAPEVVQDPGVQPLTQEAPAQIATNSASSEPPLVPTAPLTAAAATAAPTPAVIPGAPSNDVEVPLAPGVAALASKPVDLALATPPGLAPVPSPPSAVVVPALPPDSAVPVMTSPEIEGQSAISDTQCFPAAERPRPTVLANRRDTPAPDPEAFGLELAQAARSQIHEFVIYNDRYTQIGYPMGDVAPMYGVCTDVIIRAYRDVGIDLQELVHKTRAGSDDKNIAHRRVDTLRRFFTLHGESLPITTFAEDYRPGDIISYYRPQNRHSRTHIAVVSDRYAPSGRPMIIHNRGWGPQQEDGLFVDEITGHYRFTGMRLAAISRAPSAALKPKKETSLQSVRPISKPAKKVIKASLKTSGTAAAAAAGTNRPAKVR